MSDPLGLSIGTTNVVAARVGNPPVMRRSVLTMSGQRISGFVERVGDPVPMVAADGSSYLADQLVVEALDALIGSGDASQIAVAVPAHWNGATLRALRTAMRSKPSLAPNGVPARLVPDAVAALTALHANPGLPDRGVVALMDFGGGGTSITLADAASSFEPIETRRVRDFSGDQIDQALLARVLDGIAESGGVDPAGTAAVGSLTLLREECRRAKEALSDQPSTDVSVELPGYRSAVSVTRAELEAVMDAPLAKVLSEFDELLLRNRIAWADVSSVVTVGGGARIPLVTQRLSGHTESAVVTTPRPALDAAVGAAVFAAHALDADAQTGVAPAALITQADADGPSSATFRALAWSQDDDAAVDPVPYTGVDPYAGETGTTGSVAQHVPSPEPSGSVDPSGSFDDEPRAWQRLPQLAFGLAAVVALIAVGGVAVALTSASDDSRPTPSTAPVTATSTLPPTSALPPPPTSALPPPPPLQAPPSVVTVTSEAPPPPETVTVEPTTTTATTTTTTTTTPPTTTTTTPTTTTTTPTTTTTTPTTPTATTSYITVPFVPVPIPIQVPVNPNPPPVYPQQPQFPY